jgi:trimethylamine---corrinoid protein Co-methyltransferase
MIYGMGMLDMGMTLSLQQFVIDDEIARMILRSVAGMQVSSEHLAVDVIQNVGIGGHYMVEDHTLKHMKEEVIDAELFTRENYDGWLSKGKPEVKDLATAKVKKILSTHEVTPLAAGLEQEFDKIIKSMED